MMTNSMDINLVRLLEIKGVDGYMRLDLGLELLESYLPESFDEAHTLESIRNLLNNQAKVADFESSILMVEKGVIQIAKVQNFYLLILAGYKEAVDITHLTTIISEIKSL